MPQYHAPRFGHCFSGERSSGSGDTTHGRPTGRGRGRGAPLAQPAPATPVKRKGSGSTRLEPSQFDRSPRADEQEIEADRNKREGLMRRKVTQEAEELHRAGKGGAYQKPSVEPPKGKGKAFSAHGAGRGKGGGGRKDLAQAGGSSLENINKAIDKVKRNLDF